MTIAPRKPRPRLDRPVPKETGRGPTFRFLPVVIVAAVFLLGLRIQVVVSDIATSRASTTVAVEQSKALAQAQPAMPAKDAMAKDAMAKDAMAKDAMAKDAMAKDAMAKTQWLNHRPALINLLKLRWPMVLSQPMEQTRRCRPWR